MFHRPVFSIYVQWKSVNNRGGQLRLHPVSLRQEKRIEKCCIKHVLSLSCYYSFLQNGLILGKINYISKLYSEIFLRKRILKQICKRRGLLLSPVFLTILMENLSYGNIQPLKCKVLIIKHLWWQIIRNVWHLTTFRVYFCNVVCI